MEANESISTPEVLMTQQQAYKWLRSQGLRGITVTMLKNAAASGAVEVYRPKNRPFYTRPELLKWAQGFNSGGNV